MPRLLLLLLSACGPKATGSCPTDPVDGISATVDGAAWSASEVTWSLTGESVHLVSTSEDAGWLSVVAQTTADGTTVAAALDAGAFPIEVTLQSGLEGGFATWYSADNDASATTEGGGGTLTLSAEDDAGLTGCIAFTAGPDGGSVDFQDGQFTATPL